MTDSTPVLGIPIFNGSISDLSTVIWETVQSEEPIARQISVCDANVLVSSKSDSRLRKILKENTFLNLADGMPGVWIARAKGAKHIHRCYGPDVFKALVSNTKIPLRHFFSGGKPGVADRLKQFSESEFRNGNIVGTHCPPFRELSDDEIVDISNEINAASPDVVWIGISSPKQDFYAARLAKHLKVHFIITVGAAFDFYTGNVKQAPVFIRKIGMEWLFRTAMEPRRLLGRYLRVVPRFLYLGLLDVLFHKSGT